VRKDLKTKTVGVCQGAEPAATVAREFVRVEKNLGTIGFFTPSKSRSQGELREKVIRFKREIGGKTVVAEATIIPSVTLGLPTTADQDKYLAFQKIVNERRTQQGGEISNPVRFTSSELLAILGIGQAGKNYHEVYEWLERMAATTIRSQGVVYLAKRKLYARDIFHVFDRVVIMGGELPDGRVADSNYVWLSSWQLDNINQNYLLPVDFETYRGLKNNIAKALVPLFQLWLYASRSNGVFEKRYDDLCELLALRKQRYASDIQKQLGPSLDELQFKGFLSAWSLELTNDGRSHKITASHGPKFFADQRPQTSTAPKIVEADGSAMLLPALVSRAIMESQAVKLLRALPPDQPVMDQIEYIDSIIQRGRIDNPPGFYVSMLKENIPVPDCFETTARRTARRARERDYFEKQALEFEQNSRYEDYLRTELDRHIAEVLGEEQFAALVKACLPKCKKRYPNVPRPTLVEIAESSVRCELRQSLPVLSFDEFRDRPQQSTLF
jgi:Replication initiator protein A